MTQQHIKEKREYFEEQIVSAKQGLQALRAICKHPNTITDLFYYEPAHSFKAIICSDCGDVVENLDATALQERLDSFVKTEKE